MTDEQLFTYCETVADIAYACGLNRLHLSDNSRERIRTMISWAREFNERHKDTDWDETDYLETIDAFIATKLEIHQPPLDIPCPICGLKKLRHETIDYPDPSYAVFCVCCKRYEENESAKEFVRLAAFKAKGQGDDLIIHEAECETIDILLTPEKYPVAFNRKVQCVMSGGMTRLEAEEYVRTTPICLEVYYDIGRGLFAVESEAVDNTEIFNPFTGKEIPKEEES